MANIGDRVGAINCIADNKAELFGYGVYQGDKVIPMDLKSGPMADTLAELKVPNPCILLDSGKTVYGCECWWDTEEEMKEQLKDMEITIVDIDQVRKENTEEQC